MLPIQDVKRRLRKYEAATETHQVSARRMLNAAIERGDTALRTDAVAGAWKRLAGGGARENVRERMEMQETLEKLKGEEREISKVMGRVRERLGRMEKCDERYDEIEAERKRGNGSASVDPAFRKECDRAFGGKYSPQEEMRKEDIRKAREDAERSLDTLREKRSDMRRLRRKIKESLADLGRDLERIEDMEREANEEGGCSVM